ncbi:MAG: TolC family protein [Acidobacteriota bacterium]
MRKVLAALLAVLASAASAAAQPSAPLTLTFEEAVARALANSPTVADAAQAILRAEAALQQAGLVRRPTIGATVTTTVLNEARGFDGLVTQPRTQTFIGGSVAYPVLAAARWAEQAQAADQVGIARIGADEVRRQIGIATGQAYLALIAVRRQVEVNQRALENARAHLDFARARLEAGAGSRLNELRAAQEVETDEVLLESSRLGVRLAQEALGLLVAADGPVDAAGEPGFEVPAAPADAGWLSSRTDVRLFDARVEAADRVVADSWKDWIPNGAVSFNPQFVTPAGLFQPSNTWSAVVQFGVPLFDAGQRRLARRQREIAAASARLQRTDVELAARTELRQARASVESTERALAHARLAASHAAEVVRITDVAYRAGATTNLELIDAQRRARDADTAAAQAEDRVRQARFALLVALGRFP